MERLKKLDWKDIGMRSIKTFVQTFISYLTIDGIFAISDKVGFQRWLLTTGLSALAGAISAVWNLIMGIISDKAGEALDKIGDYETEDNLDEDEVANGDFEENDPINESEVD